MRSKKMMVGVRANLQQSCHVQQFIQMEQAVLKARQEKQAYICGNIDPNLYEDFHEFCNSYAGEIDIDRWPIVYVHELVAKFKQQYLKKNEQQDQHERSFAVYQTTTGDNQISGSATLEMDQILQSLEAPQKVPTKVTTSPANTTSNKNYQSPRQSESSPAPFSKKQPQTISATVSPTNNKQKLGPSKSSALDLLDSAFQQVGGTEKSKIEENAQKMNKSFFDSVNFWEVPKVDDGSKNKVQKAQTNQLSPNKQFKSVKLNLNVNQLTKNGNSGSGKKVEEPQPIKNMGSQIETFSYTNENKAQNYFKTGTISPPVNSPTYNKSQFDTFSILADQELKKKRTNTVSVNLDKNDETRKKSTSTIALKNVKQLKTSPVTSSKISSFKEQYKGPRLFKTDFVDHVFCVKSSIRPNLANQNLAIQIKNFEIIERSIFASNYLMYSMRVMPSGIICKRNYEDFTKFKATLEKFYPGIQMPYLEKEGWRVETSQQYARKQIQAIQFFIGDVLRNPELRNSRVTEQFLSIKDHKTMKRKFQQYDKMTKLKSIEELCLLNGKVEVALTENERIYNENMTKFVIKFENNLQKYRKNCENLANYYSQVMSTMLNIDDIFKDMQKDVEQFNRIVAIKQIEHLEGSIKKVRDHYKQSYFRTKFEKSIIEQNILPFVRYEKENTRTSKDILQLCNNLTSRYLKRMESETAQNLDNSYLSATYNEYKQSITEESKSILVLKYQAGYWQAQASSELQRIMTNMGIKTDEVWRKIAAKYLDQLAKSVNLWSQLS